MNNNEAKFILSAYRPGGRDAGDPGMATALAQAKSDPVLGAWFARERAHDAAVAWKLRAVVPPVELREAILTGARVSGGAAREVGGERAGPKVRPTQRRAWWAQPGWLAAVAAVAVLVSLAAWRMTPVRGEAFEEFAVNFVDKGFMLQKRGADVASLKVWLGEQRGPLPEALPAKFAELRALGCRTLTFKGQDVSLMCFERGGKEFHVFVARREGVDAAGAERGPRFLDGQKGGHVAATWADAKNRYVVVSDAKLEALKPWL